MGKKAVIVGAMDTKGEEFAFVKEILNRSGVDTWLVDSGVLGHPRVGLTPDTTSAEVAAAGGATLEQLREERDRGNAVAVMTKGVAKVVAELVNNGVVSALFGMGGTAGTTVAAAAMKAAPIGLPKLLVSTVASGNTSPYVGVKDVTMMYSVIDIAGLNSLSRRILSNAAYALAGMVQEIENEKSAQQEAKPVLGMTMFGVTTPCCTRVREALEAKGFEVLVFHATGTGGLAMEALIRDGFIQGVLDITTTELADDLVGGIFSAGPRRLEAAAEAGIPQVVSVGALDMVNFGPPESVPPLFKHRTFYPHNPTTTLMRTTVEENEELGRRLARKLNRNKARTVLVFPHGGVSMLDTSGQAFEGRQEREALWRGIRSVLDGQIPVLESNMEINDPVFADMIVEHFTELFDRE